MYITVVSPDGTRALLNISELIGKTLLEVLTRYGYLPSMRCTGNGKCRSCAVQVIARMEKLKPADEDETFLLDLLEPHSVSIRLACRLHIHPIMNGLIIKLETKQNTPSGKGH